MGLKSENKNMAISIQEYHHNKIREYLGINTKLKSSEVSDFQDLMNKFSQSMANAIVESVNETIDNSKVTTRSRATECILQKYKTEKRLKCYEPIITYLKDKKVEDENIKWITDQAYKIENDIISNTLRVFNRHLIESKISTKWK